MTHFAAAAGLVVESELPLLGLCPARPPASFFFSIGSVGLASLAVEWIQQWTIDDGHCWLTCGRVAHGYLLRFTGVADVLIDRDSGSIVGEPHPGVDPAAVAAVVAGQVIPRLLSLDGTPVLHASAVAVDGTAFVFAGESGAGKSTFAAAVCGSGGELLADDFVALEAGEGVVRCRPTSATVSLAPSSMTMLRLPAAAGGLPACPAGARPVGAIYLLDRDRTAGTTSESVPPRDAFVRLYRLSYRMDAAATAVARAEFARLTAVVAAVPVRVLHAPRGPERLRGVVDALVNRSRRRSRG